MAATRKRPSKTDEQTNENNYVTLDFTFERATKNTKRFAEDSETPVVGTIYVQNSALADLGDPDKLTVTIEAA